LSSSLSDRQESNAEDPAEREGQWGREEKREKFPLTCWAFNNHGKERRRRRAGAPERIFV
jgi:hypothetical protein